MSTRFGMADGRCFTENVSSRLYNDNLIKNMNITTPLEYRRNLQEFSQLEMPTCKLFEYDGTKDKE
jgi:hypothetical protein